MISVCPKPILIIDKNVFQEKSLKTLQEIAKQYRLGITDTLLYELATDEKDKEEHILLKKLSELRDYIIIFKHPNEILGKNMLASFVPDSLFYDETKHEEILSGLEPSLNGLFERMKKVLDEFRREREGTIRLTPDNVKEIDCVGEGSESAFIIFDNEFRKVIGRYISEQPGQKDFRSKNFNEVKDALRSCIFTGNLCKVLFGFMKNGSADLSNITYESLRENTLFKNDIIVHAACILERYRKHGIEQFEDKHKDSCNFYHDIAYLLIALSINGKLATEDKTLKNAAMILDDAIIVELQ